MRAPFAVIALLLLGGCPAERMPPDEPPPCPQPNAEACGARRCGVALNTCGQTVGCGACPSGETCSADGGCEPQGCVSDPMAACAGKSCGRADAGCGTEAMCGTCMGAAVCTGDGRCELDAGVDAGTASDGGFTCTFTRTLTDRPDDSSLPQVRALYVIPSDLTDEGNDTNGRICRSLQASSAWLAEQVGRSLRFDTAGGALDVGFVRLSRTDAQMHGSTSVANVSTGYAYVRERIELELADAGTLQPHKLYAVFYGGTSEYACGGAAYPPTLPGKVIAMYVKAVLSGVPCEQTAWGSGAPLRYYDWAMLHDLMHGLGIVPSAAPNHHAFGHVFDTASTEPERDLMYAARTGADPPWPAEGSPGLRLDLGRDDYFSHDGGWFDLRSSGFLDPTPPNAVLPLGF